jgi:predicted transcriptional regulator
VQAIYRAAERTPRLASRQEIRATKLMLSKRVSIGYTAGMKDSGLRIRVQRDLRDKFLQVCRAQDKPAAQVIREFMRHYVERQERAQDSPAKKQGRSKAGLRNDY